LNAYSSDWFALFMDTIPPRQTLREVEFVNSYLSPESVILDLPCGTGRHARLLADLGHHVIAIDRNAAVLRPESPERLSVVCADMRHLPLRPASVDALVCLWQSFGYHDANENLRVLRTWRETVRAGGLLILDLFHRSHFELEQGERVLDRNGERVTEVRRMEGDRLIVELSYPDRGGSDRFEWQLFTPKELTETARRANWKLITVCSGFQRTGVPIRARVQYVFRAVAA
jgi:SAM-dependent methyltransferase